MSTAADPGSELTSADERDLRQCAGFMVPASAGYGVSGADDAAIFADIVRSPGRDRSAVRAAAMTLLGCDGLVITAFGRVMPHCYYRDDRVMSAVGIEPAHRIRWAARSYRVTGRCSMPGAAARGCGGTLASGEGPRA